MRGIGTDQARLARRRPGQQVAADIARGEAKCPQAGDHQVGEILADAALLLEHLHDRRRHGGCLGIELEFSEDFRHQRLGTDQDRRIGREAIGGIGGQLMLDTDMRALEQEARRVEIFRQRRRRIVGQAIAHGFPGQRSFQVFRQMRRDGDGHRRTDTQAVMRGVEGDPGYRVAERVLAVAPPAGLRHDLNALLLDLLPGQDARRQVQLLL